MRERHRANDFATVGPLVQRPVPARYAAVGSSRRRPRRLSASTPSVRMPVSTATRESDRVERGRCNEAGRVLQSAIVRDEPCHARADLACFGSRLRCVHHEGRLIGVGGCDHRARGDDGTESRDGKRTVHRDGHARASVDGTRQPRHLAAEPETSLHRHRADDRAGRPPTAQPRREERRQRSEPDAGTYRTEPSLIARRTPYPPMTARASVNDSAGSSPKRPGIQPRRSDTPPARRAPCGDSRRQRGGGPRAVADRYPAARLGARRPRLRCSEATT